MSRELYTNPSNGRLYYLIHSSEWSSWQGATGSNSWINAALYSGGNLVTVNDIDEYNWLTRNFSLFNGLSGPTSAWSRTPAWIGLTDRNTEGQLEWMSREPLNPDLKNTHYSFGRLLYTDTADPVDNNIIRSLDYGYLHRGLTEVSSNPGNIGPSTYLSWGFGEGNWKSSGFPVESAIVEMDPGIFVEAKYVRGTGTYYHLYLVYRDNNGDERVIRGDEYIDSGTLAVQIDALLRDTFDKRRDPDTQEPLAPVDRFSRRIDIGKRNADDVWNVMIQQAQNIADANLDYNAYISAQNSNSLVASTLHSVGIDIKDNLPTEFTDPSYFPGFDNLLNIRTTLKGRNGARDIIYGGQGGSVLWGEGGRDILVGEGGNNTIHGGNGNDLITAGGNNRNRILAGKGFDKIVLAKDARDLIYIRPDEGLDFIREFSVGEDKLVLMGGLKVEDLEFKENNKNTLITTGGEKLVSLYGVSPDEAKRIWL